MKTKTVVLLMFLTAFTALKAQNPICPIGYYIADPTARVWKDGQLYIYGSTDESPDYYCSHQHDVLFSPDLKNWTLKKNILSSKGENDQLKETDALLFAPDIMFRNNKYFLYFCTPSGSYSEGVAISRSPLGPFTQARKLNLGGHNEIDPTIFVDDDGQAYYFWGQFRLKGAKMKSNMVELDTATINPNVINNKEHCFHEGSFMFKRNGIYYLVYAHEGRRDRRPTCIGYSTSNSPMGPFKYGGVIIDNFGCDPEVWNNHGSVAEFNGQWYIFYHRASHACVKMRRACMEPIYFNPDGSIDEVEMTTQGPCKPLDARQSLEAERACLLNGYCRVRKIGEGNEAVYYIKDGDGATYKYLDFGEGVSRFKATVYAHLGGSINVRIDGPEGRILGRMTVDGPKTYKEYVCDLEKVSGVHALYLEFIGMEKGARLFDLDRFVFE